MATEAKTAEIDTAYSPTPATLRAKELIELHKEEPPSWVSFNARTITTIAENYTMDFSIEKEGAKQYVFCYKDGVLVSKREIEDAAIPKLLPIYLAMLEPFRKQYSLTIRLATQQHDMLPIIAEQTAIIHDLEQHKKLEPVINPKKVDDIQSEIIRMKEKIIHFAMDPVSPTSTRTKEEIRSIQALHPDTIATLAKLTGISTYLHSYLNDVSDLAINALTDDPWKQARIQNSSHWDNFSHIFEDGIHGELSIITELLTYHCYVNNVSLHSLKDAIAILEDERFMHSLRALLGTTNGANVDLFTFGDVPADFLEKADIPVISDAGKKYLKNLVKEQNEKVAQYQDMHWDNTPIDNQQQRRCPAGIHSASLRKATSAIPQPGESTAAYLDHLQEVAKACPDAFSLEEKNDTLELKMKIEPIDQIRKLFIAALTAWEENNK